MISHNTGLRQQTTNAQSGTWRCKRRAQRGQQGHPRHTHLSTLFVITLIPSGTLCIYQVINHICLFSDSLTHTHCAYLFSCIEAKEPTQSECRVSICTIFFGRVLMCNLYPGVVAWGLGGRILASNRDATVTTRARHNRNHISSNGYRYPYGVHTPKTGLALQSAWFHPRQSPVLCSIVMNFGELISLASVMDRIFGTSPTPHCGTSTNVNIYKSSRIDAHCNTRIPEVIPSRTILTTMCQEFPVECASIPASLLNTPISYHMTCNHLCTQILHLHESCMYDHNKGF